jgi:hypothetical protein
MEYLGVNLHHVLVVYSEALFFQSEYRKPTVLCARFANLVNQH